MILLSTTSERSSAENSLSRTDVPLALSSAEARVVGMPDGLVVPSEVFTTVCSVVVNDFAAVTSGARS